MDCGSAFASSSRRISASTTCDKTQSSAAENEPDNVLRPISGDQNVGAPVGSVRSDTTSRIGAVFGAILTMYSAVATRAREIATLRAVGFNTSVVLVSVLSESLALGAIGGIIGAVAAYVAFNGYETSTMNFQTFSQVAFAFRVTPTLLGMGLSYALLMGLIGGLLPAIRAARLPIASALREL
jgi:hypothetical protein